jgi:hypothetical protein
MAMAMVGLVVVNGKKVLKVESNEGHERRYRRVSIHLPANFTKFFFACVFPPILSLYLPANIYLPANSIDTIITLHPSPSQSLVFSSDDHGG